MERGECQERRGHPSVSNFPNRRIRALFMAAPILTPLVDVTVEKVPDMSLRVPNLFRDEAISKILSMSQEIAASRSLSRALTRGSSQRRKIDFFNSHDKGRSEFVYNCVLGIS
jgi:hypothetical protein